MNPEELLKELQAALAKRGYSAAAVADANDTAKAFGFASMSALQAQIAGGATGGPAVASDNTRAGVRAALANVRSDETAAAVKKDARGLARGVARGLTFNLDDNAARALGVGTGAGGMYSPEGEAEFREFKKNSPVAALISEGVGGLVTGGGLAKAGIGAGKAGLSLGRSMLQGAKVGAGYGAAYGAGDAESAPDATLGRQIVDRTIGAGVGGAAGGLAGAALPLLASQVKGAVTGTKNLIRKAQGEAPLPNPDSPRSLLQALTPSAFADRAIAREVRETGRGSPLMDNMLPTAEEDAAALTAGRNVLDLTRRREFTATGRGNVVAPADLSPKLGALAARAAAESPTVAGSTAARSLVDREKQAPLSLLSDLNRSAERAGFSANDLNVAPTGMENQIARNRLLDLAQPTPRTPSPFTIYDPIPGAPPAPVGPPGLPSGQPQLPSGMADDAAQAALPAGRSNLPAPLSGPISRPGMAGAETAAPEISAAAAPSSPTFPPNSGVLSTVPPRTSGLQAGARKQELADMTRVWADGPTGYGRIPSNGEPGVGLRAFVYRPFGKPLDSSVSRISQAAARNANTPLGNELQSIAAETARLRGTATQFDEGKNLFTRVDDLISKGYETGGGRKKIGGVELDLLKKLRTRIQNGMDEQAAANGAQFSFSTVQGEYARRKGLEDALDLGSRMFNRTTQAAGVRGAPAAEDDLRLAFEALAPEAQAEARYSYAARKLDELRQEAGSEPGGLAKRLTSHINSNEGRDLAFAFDNPANYRRFMYDTARENVVQDGVQAFTNATPDEIGAIMRNLRMTGRELGGDEGAQVLQRQFRRGLIGALANRLRAADTGREAQNAVAAGGDIMRRKLDIAFGPREARKLTARAAGEAKLTTTSQSIASAVAVPRGNPTSEAQDVIGTGTATRALNSIAGPARRLARRTVGDRYQQRIAQITMQQGQAGRQAFDAAMQGQMVRTQSPRIANGILARLFGQQAGQAVAPNDQPQP